MFSGVNSTIETISNSELIDALLEHFALKMVVRNYDKTLTKKFENNVWISKILAWMNCMTEVIIWVQKFFCFGHFLIIFSKMMDQKVTQAKKVTKIIISFSMPVNHVQKFLISVHSRSVF